MFSVWKRMVPPVRGLPLYRTRPETLAGAWGFFAHPASRPSDRAAKNPNRSAGMGNGPFACRREKGERRRHPAGARGGGALGAFGGGGERRGLSPPGQARRLAAPPSSPTPLPVVAEHEPVVGDQGPGEGGR